jgi:hypothetical protein
MAKFTLLGTFERDRISGVVPPEYRDRALALTRDGVCYLVVQFAHDRRDVVTSAPVRRALEDIPGDQLVLVVGANFTVEAEMLLEARGALIARLGDFRWTDESYQSLHQ